MVIPGIIFIFPLTFFFFFTFGIKFGGDNAFKQTWLQLYLKNEYRIVTETKLRKCKKKLQSLLGIVIKLEEECLCIRAN